MKNANDTLLRRLKKIGTGLIVALGIVGIAAEDKKSEFSKPVIDIGIVVRDSAASARFYTNAIGFTEVPGFPVSGELGKKIGLIDGHPVNVRVFVLGEGDLATRIKLLSFPNVPSRSPDQDYIHSTLGIRYLTIYVNSIQRALERLKKAGVSPIGETPVDLGGGTKIVVVRDPDGNFIELIGPE
ncbi:MAG: VOC family protein [Verrucomicrobiae bacterium]|nr:VOC family protein [Verrucomicrobiae bacterium]